MKTLDGRHWHLQGEGVEGWLRWVGEVGHIYWRTLGGAWKKERLEGWSLPDLKQRLRDRLEEREGQIRAPEGDSLPADIR
jgi:hypothetical protein